MIFRLSCYDQTALSYKIHFKAINLYGIPCLMGSNSVPKRTGKVLWILPLPLIFFLLIVFAITNENKCNMGV